MSVLTDSPYYWNFTAADKRGYHLVSFFERLVMLVTLSLVQPLWSVDYVLRLDQRYAQDPNATVSYDPQ